MRRTVLGVVAILGAGMIACGGGAAAGGPSEHGGSGLTAEDAPSGPVNKSGGDEVIARMGPAGGSLEISSGGGARVEIPPGCIEGAVDIIFKKAPRTTAFKDADVRGDKPVGPIVLVSPAVYAPEGKSIVVSIPFGGIPEGYSEEGLYLAHEEESQQQRQFAEDTTVTTWDYVQARVVGGRAVAELPALSGMRLQFILSSQE
jgi:hypothetical protein